MFSLVWWVCLLFIGRVTADTQSAETCLSTRGNKKAERLRTQQGVQRTPVSVLKNRVATHPWFLCFVGAEPWMY